MPAPQLEIAVQDIEGARVAADGGADRLEVCQGLALGGLTPSRGLMAQVAEVGLPFRVLIRPRAGGYEYSRAEIAVMVGDIETALECGAAGVVIGALAGRVLDQRVVQTLGQVAAGRPVIIHRCVDVLLAQGTEPAEVAEQIIAAGATGVLTSGGAARARDGRQAIGALAAAAGPDLEVIAGGGVQPADIPELAATGIGAIHLSARRKTSAGPAGPGGGTETVTVTDLARVRTARAAVDGEG